jgi:hypothetical protein
VRLVLAEANPEGLVSWVLGLGRGVQVISPAGLRREVARVAGQVADRHAQAAPRARPRRRS